MSRALTALALALAALASLVSLASVACSGSAKHVASAPAAPLSQLERMVALLPDGVQLVAELDLARLRANPTVGAIAVDVFGKVGDAKLPNLVGKPLAMPTAPLATAEALVLGAYGVGTAQAATVTLIATPTDLPGAVRITPDLVALGPADWVGQLQTRAAILSPGRREDGSPKLVLAADLRELRERAVPEGATGAILRIYARLGFDARVGLARMTGFDPAPAQLSLWADVADDFAAVVDVDVTDPGEREHAKTRRRGIARIQSLLVALADVPLVRALGIPNSLLDANIRIHRGWIRATVTISPRHLARVVERARAMLAAP